MLPKRVLYYGKDEDLPAQTALRAGPLSLLYERGDLRYIRLGNREILRRIYVAVRDRNWGTVAPVFSSVTMEVEHDSFRINYTVSNRQDEIDFAWQGSIRGEADGTITFTMDGEAHSSFWRNRIGFCILYPASLGGRSAVVEHVDGREETAVFPIDVIADQPVRPFYEMRSVAHEVLPGVLAEVRFTGDVFEMEDQRNWTDASYKIFSTPLRLPYPMQVERGSRITQSVQIRLGRSQPGLQKGQVGGQQAAVELSIERAARALPVPFLGLGTASHGQPSEALHPPVALYPQVARQTMDEKTLEHLRLLHLHHLRVDVQPGSVGARKVLEQAAEQARALNAGLEVALFIPVDAQGALESLRRIVDELRPPVIAWLCYPAKESFRGGSPVSQVVAAARKALHSYDPAVPFCAGTNYDFIFLQRSIPPLEQIEQITLAICPQVHAFDNASLVETLPVQGELVRSARRIGQGKPVRISPVTLRMRSNPYATGPALALEPGELPPQVDERQMSLFGAGWTLASFKYLAEAETASITYFETGGWRGVIEREEGSPLPEVFRSLPGGVFPVYHALADIAEFAGGSLLPVTSSQPLKVNGVCLCKGSAERVLLANHTAEPQSVQLKGLRYAYMFRVLNETNAMEAMQSPEEFRRQPGKKLSATGGRLVVELRPFSVARLDR